jgi:hypothetical protein
MNFFMSNLHKLNYEKIIISELRKKKKTVFSRIFENKKYKDASPCKRGFGDKFLYLV